MATQSEIQALINQIVPNGNYTAEEMNTLLTTMLSYTSSIVDIERVALQSLISSVGVNTNAIYKITDGVSDTKVIFVFGLTTSSITDNALNITDGTFGTYDITTDLYQTGGGTILTPDEVDAIEGANAPDSTNVFATINDLQNPDLSEVYTEGNTVNGYALTMDSASGGILGITLSSSFAGSTNVVAFGEGASSGSTHTNAVAIGDFAASSRNGTNIVALGNYAGNFSEGSNVNAFGLESGRFSKVGNLNALGYKAASNIAITKTNINALGSEAAKGSSGDNVNAFGNSAALDNSGSRVNAFGLEAAALNISNDVNAFGDSALAGNSGFSSTAIGKNAGRKNSGAFSTFIGGEAGYDSNTDIGNSLSSSFVISNIYIPEYANRAAAVAGITVVLGAVANNTYLYYNTTTFAIEAVRL
tara:strand:+ start:2652 stop:3902 length:1251 start_codon:yes stop_codon:yes gene_type:complete